MAIRPVKHHYFFVLLAFAQFKATQSLPGKARSPENLQGHCKKYSTHMGDKVTVIDSEFDSDWVRPV